MSFTYRLAQRSDIDIIRALMEAAIYELQKDFLSEAQLEVAGLFMGVDTTLIDDQTYFLILHDEDLETEQIVGCGGWGKCKTLYGGNHSPGCSDELLDPKTDRARIRAMYCHPDWARLCAGLSASLHQAPVNAHTRVRRQRLADRAGRLSLCGLHARILPGWPWTWGTQATVISAGSSNRSLPLRLSKSSSFSTNWGEGKPPAALFVSKSADTEE